MSDTKTLITGSIEDYIQNPTVKNYLVPVRMTAFNDADSYEEHPERIVSIPVQELLGKSGPELLNALLDGAYKYGQNDFQPMQQCSVSVADVIELRGPCSNLVAYFVVAGCGFNQIDRGQCEALAEADQRMRFFHPVVKTQ